MGLLGKLFEKKECAICGGEIGLLGNRKLEDGNMCKNCAAKLSPWFSERRASTVEQIKQQLAYREENQKNLASFHTTVSYGTGMKVLIDEDQQKFVVTRAKNLEEANPDILDYAMVTGVDTDVSESRSEEKRKDKDGKLVSYNPPRYTYSYTFHIVIRVNHPYFDEIRFPLNDSSIKTNPGGAVPAHQKPNQLIDQDYIEYDNMAKEIKRTLTSARQQVRDEITAANAPKMAVTCPWCGATTTPTTNGTCEYCGGSINN